MAKYAFSIVFKLFNALPLKAEILSSKIPAKPLMFLMRMLFILLIF